MINELEILKHIDHPYIMKTYEQLQDTDNYYMVSELAKDGELKTHIEERVQLKKPFSEYQAKKIIW